MAANAARRESKLTDELNKLQKSFDHLKMRSEAMEQLLQEHGIEIPPNSPSIHCRHRRKKGLCQRRLTVRVIAALCQDILLLNRNMIKPE